LEKKLTQIKSKSLASVVSLLAQGSYSAALGFAAFFILTVKSGAYLLGIYNTVLATLSSFNYFTNLGLAAAIMQKKDVRQIDLNSAFYIQFFLTIVAVIIGFMMTPLVFSFYKDLPSNTVSLYWAVLISFFFLSLKSIPSVLLEKKIEIYKVVVVQAIENTVFYLTVIILVLLGYTIESLIIAVMARAITGLILMYILNPWFPTLSFSWDSAKSLLKYGIPFQGNSFLALIKDDLLIIYLGGTIGLTNLGYVTFAKKYAEFSIRLIMDNVNRVGFPLFVTFQNDKKLLKKALQKVYFYESLLIIPAVMGALFIFDVILKIVPGDYYQKWHLALVSFYFFSLSSFFVALYSPLINFFNAIGRVKTSVAFMVYFTAFTWLSIPIAIKVFDFNGISIAFFIMSLSYILVVRKAQQYIKFSLFNFIKYPLLGGFSMMLFLVILRFIFFKLFLPEYFYLFFALVGGATVYFMMLYKFIGRKLFTDVTDIFYKK